MEGLNEDRNDSINKNIMNKKKYNPFEHSRCSSAYEIVFSHCKKKRNKSTNRKTLTNKERTKNSQQTNYEKKKIINEIL